MAHVPGRRSVIWIADTPPTFLEYANFAIYPVEARGLIAVPKAQAEEPRCATPSAEHPVWRWRP